MDGCACSGSDVGVAGCVDDPFTEYGVAAGLALDNHASQHLGVYDRSDHGCVQDRVNSGLLHKDVRDVLEQFAVERVAGGLRLGLGGAHRLCTLLELDADAFGVDCVLVAVPRESFNADGGDVATEAAMPLE